MQPLPIPIEPAKRVSAGLPGAAAVAWLGMLLALAPELVLAGTSDLVLVIHSYSQDYPWTSGQQSGFIEEFPRLIHRRTDYSTEYLGTKRLPYTEARGRLFADYLQTKYAGLEPRLIYVTDDDALDFADAHLQRMFPNTPIIYSGAEDTRRMRALDATRFTGVHDDKQLGENLRLVHQLDPAAREVLVIGDDSPSWEALRIDLAQQSAEIGPLEVRFLVDQNLDRLLTDLAERNQRYVVLATLGAFTNVQGDWLSPEEALLHIRSAGDFLLLALEDTYVGTGVLGGHVTSAERQGRAAARLAARALSDPGHLPAPILSSPNRYVFDHLELERSGLQLPPEIADEALIVNRPAPFHLRHRVLLLTLLAIFNVCLLLTLGLLSWLLWQRNRRLREHAQTLTQQAQSLAETRDMLTEAQRIAQLGTWRWDPVSKLCEWSEETFHILGEKPEPSPQPLDRLLQRIHPDDRETLTQHLDDAIEGRQGFDLEHRLRLSDGDERHVRHTVRLSARGEGGDQILLATLIDVSRMKKIELEEIQRLERIERYQDALLEWSRSQFDDLSAAVRRATEISAETLRVPRVGVWLYEPDPRGLRCADLYVLNQGHQQGQWLLADDFPSYFRAIDSGRVLSIQDARSDPRSSQFKQTYLIPEDIHSMLDVPILVGGDVAGVVCHEQLAEPREWQPYEIEFASAIASTIALALETERRRKMERELAHHAYHDDLTGLPNRQLFVDRLEQALRVAQRTGELVAVLLLDLDNFKEINDSFGHSAGDDLLSQVALRLKSCRRGADTLARLGGDEFCLMAGGFDTLNGINDLALRIQEELKQPFQLHGNDLFLTTSTGIAIHPNDGRSSLELMRNADAAMYRAKDEGRNGFQYYTQDMTERAFERVLMETSLRRGVANKEFIVLFQPQIDAREDRLVGMEALVRWQHPELGLIGPGRFMPVAEDSDLVVRIDRQVMSTALRQLGQWYRAGLRPGRLFLNLAMKQLIRDDLVEFVHKMLRETGCQSDWIGFEVTESQVMQKPERAIQVLRELSSLGVHIAVDDFGTGYSSLAYLKRLPVDKLKIDSSFIRDIPDDGNDTAIVLAIIALGRSMGLELIAEGVEHKRQRQFLLDNACHIIQGYLYARPLTAADLEARFLAPAAAKTDGPEE